MNFQEVGEILRQERLQKGLSIEEVMQETKVSRRHLEAIEDGRVEDLPHPVYVKGFINTYARMLSIEVKGLGAAVDTAFAHVIEEEEQEERRRHRTRDITLSSGNRKSPGSKIIVVILLLAVLGGAGYGVWWYFFQPGTNGSSDSMQPAVVTPQSTEPETEQETSGGMQNGQINRENDAQPMLPPEPVAPPVELIPEPLPGASSMEQPGNMPAPPGLTVPAEALPADGAQENAAGQGDTAATAVAPVDASGQTESGQADVGLAEPGQTEAAQAEAGQTPENAEEASGEKPIVIASSAARAADKSTVSILEVNGSGECWIEAKVDKDFTTDFYVREGERVQLWFTRTLAVKFGNIGEVSLSYNGSPYTTSIPPSGVKTLTFPPSP